MKLIYNLLDAAAKRAAYKRTVEELSRLPLDVALDLGIYKGEAHEIARRAVYGC